MDKGLRSPSKIISTVTGNIQKQVEKYPVMTTGLVLFLISLMLYRNFIIKGVPFLATSSDGAFQFFPYHVNIHNYLRAEGFPMWTFGAFLGAPHFSSAVGDPFKLIPTLFGEWGVRYLFVYMHICKIVLAGVFFHLYLSKLKFHNASCFIGAVTYALCGIMILRGNWPHYATEVTFLALILFASERFFSDKKWLLLVLSISLLIASLGFYYFGFYALFLFIYCTLRYFVSYDWNRPRFIRYILTCGGIYLLGVLIIFPLLLPQLILIFDSSRFHSTVEGVSFFQQVYSFFALGDARLYLSNLFRVFSSDILGRYHTYLGYSDFLGGPLYYIGLIHLLFIPQAFAFGSKRIRIIFAICLIFISLYILFPGFVRLLNANIASYYKLSSLWISVVIVIVSCYGLNKVFKCAKVNIELIAYTLCCVLSVFLFGFYFIQNVNNMALQSDITLYIFWFLSVYVFLIIMLNRYKRMLFATVAVSIVVTLEMLLFSAITINTSFHVGATFNQEVFHSNELTEPFDEAITFINQYDPDDFYRIELYPATLTSVTSAWYFGYQGTAGFHGLIPGSSIDFMSFITQRDSYPPTFVNGFYARNLLYSLVGTRYLVSEYELNRLGYSLLSEGGCKRIYKNDNWLPIAFTYEDRISLYDFEVFDSFHERDLLLLMYYIDGEYRGRKEGFPDFFEEFQFSYAFNDWNNVIKHNKAIEESNLPYYLSFNSTTNDPQLIFYPVESSMNSRFDVSFTITSDEPCSGQLFWETWCEIEGWILEWQVFSFPEGESTHSVTFDGKDVRQIRLDVGDSVGFFEIHDLNILVHDIEQGTEIISSVIEARRAEPFTVTSFGQNHIEGEITVPDNRMLFFSVPYANGWRVFVNGLEHEKQRINVGFIGVPLTEGSHRVELVYRLPGLTTGIWISVIATIACAVLYAVDKKKRGVY